MILIAIGIGSLVISYIEHRQSTHLFRDKVRRHHAEVDRWPRRWYRRGTRGGGDGFGCPSAVIA